MRFCEIYICIPLCSSSPWNTKMTRQCWCLRIWAWSPKVEVQILPQSWQGTAVLGFGTLFFLADLLSSRLCSRLLSKCFVPLRVAALQAGRSWAKACHSSTGMLQALRVDFSTSLYRFLCPPLCRTTVYSLRNIPDWPSSERLSNITRCWQETSHSGWDIHKTVLEYNYIEVVYIVCTNIIFSQMSYVRYIIFCSSRWGVV